MPIKALAKSDFKPFTHDEAARFFAKKTVLTTKQFDALSAANKARAFRIAGYSNIRLLQDARDVVHRAIRDGVDYATTRRQLMALFDRAGLPRPALHHLKTMYRRNVIQAYNEARREQLVQPDQTTAFPFWRYLTVGNGRAWVNNVRPTHAELHGKVFPWDDPFWRHFYPPWEWGCRCTVQPMTEGMVKRGRIIVYTYKSGRVVPDTKSVRGLFPAASALIKRLTGRGGPKMKEPRGFDGEQFDEKGIDAELKKILRSVTKRR